MFGKKKGTEKGKESLLTKLDVSQIGGHECVIRWREEMVEKAVGSSKDGAKEMKRILRILEVALTAKRYKGGSLDKQGDVITGKHFRMYRCCLLVEGFIGIQGLIAVSVEDLECCPPESAYNGWSKVKILANQYDLTSLLDLFGSLNTADRDGLLTLERIEFLCDQDLHQITALCAKWAVCMGDLYKFFDLQPSSSGSVLALQSNQGHSATTYLPNVDTPQPTVTKGEPRTDNVLLSELVQQQARMIELQSQSLALQSQTNALLQKLLVALTPDNTQKK